MNPAVQRAALRASTEAQARVKRENEMQDDYADADIAELMAQDAHDRKQRSKLFAAPDCRDPDHPGCADCEEAEGENE